MKYTVKVLKINNPTPIIYETNTAPIRSSSGYIISSVHGEDGIFGEFHNFSTIDSMRVTRNANHSLKDEWMEM